MPRTSKKPRRAAKQPTQQTNGTPPQPEAGPDPDVMTLAEAAAYLRVEPRALESILLVKDFPARQVGREWRFLKSALQEWLRTPIPKPSKEAMMATAGSWKDDPTVDEMLKEIYKRRGRPMTEDGE